MIISFSKFIERSASLMVSRHHHFLPQCYLKGFSEPRKRGKEYHTQVFDRNGKAFRTNIGNVASRRDFNRIDVEGHPPDVLEQAFSKFESELGPALIRLVEDRSLANEDDRILLFNLIGMAATRNPQQRETIRDFHERVTYAILELATATKERWDGQLRKMKEKGFDADHSVPYDMFRSSILNKKFRLDVPTERHIDLEMKMLDTVLPTLVERNWTVLFAPHGSRGFITSDNPVCLYFSDPKAREGIMPPGHGFRATELIFSGE